MTRRRFSTSCATMTLACWLARSRSARASSARCSAEYASSRALACATFSAATARRCASASRSRRSASELAMATLASFSPATASALAAEVRMRVSFWASARPISPIFSCSATFTLAALMAVAAASCPRASMYPLSSLMSVTLTLMSFSPTFFSSISTFFMMFSWNLSRSLLSSSMLMDAMTRRSCPKRMSRAMSCISPGVSPSRRSAALFMESPSVLMPTVKRQGTSTRMFCRERALVRLASMEMGRRLR